MELTLSEIKARVDELAENIGAPENLLPTYKYSEQTARPHVEVDLMGYHFVVAERGQELERYTTYDLDRLLNKIFVGVTFELSVKYELDHRIKNQDFRRIMFQHQVELLSVLSPQWAEKESQKHEQILKEHPFDDKGDVSG